MLKKIIAMLVGHKQGGPYLSKERLGYGGDTRGIENAQRLKRNTDSAQRGALDDVRFYDKARQEKIEKAKEEPTNI